MTDTRSTTLRRNFPLFEKMSDGTQVIFKPDLEDIIERAISIKNFKGRLPFFVNFEEVGINPRVARFISKGKDLPNMTWLELTNGWEIYISHRVDIGRLFFRKANYLP